MKNKKMLTSNLTRKRKTIWGSLISVGIMGVTAGTALSIASCSCGGGVALPTSGTFAEIVDGVKISKMDFTDFQLDSMSEEFMSFNNWFNLGFAKNLTFTEIHFYIPALQQVYYIYNEGTYYGNQTVNYNATISWTLVDLTLTISPACVVDFIDGDFTSLYGGFWC